MAIETELKLRIAPAEIERLLRHPLLETAAGSRRSEQLKAVYYDTPARDLLGRLGLGLRVRLEQGRWIQTVKSAGHGLGSLHQRREWNVEVAGPEPDYAALPEAVRALEGMNKKLFAQVYALFSTEFERQTWQLTAAGGACVEFCLDRGEILANGQREAINEIELELHQGEIGALYDIALQLLDQVPLAVENASKAQRGYALAQPRPLTACKAGQVALSPKATVAEALVLLAADCLAHWQANEALVLAGSDPEGVHQMRVGIRRLRSLFSLHKDLIAPESSLALREELRWLAGSLGPARDWDVFAGMLAEIRGRNDGNGYLKDLCVQVASQQAKAYALAQESLRSPRYTRLVLKLSAWLHKQAWLGETPSKEARQAWAQPAAQFADAILRKQHKRVCKKGVRLLELSPAERHQVRIASKKLAYGARFFASFYPENAAKAYIRSLSQLRDDLGTLHDAAIARNLLDQLGLPEDAPARFFLNGWYACHNQIKLDDLARTWNDFFSPAGLPMKIKLPK